MKKLTRSNKKLIGLILVALILVAGFFVVKKDKPKNGTSDTAQTTSNLPTAQSNFTDGNDRQPANTDKNEGTVTDNNGSVNNLPSQSSWTISESGQITVYSPAKNSLLKSGDTLAGASSVSNVYFRLIDDVSGVIAQGSLSVVNGKFSGTFNFNTSGNEGRLDVYSLTDEGVEFSNIEIPIRFR